MVGQNKAPPLSMRGGLSADATETQIPRLAATRSHSSAPPRVRVLLRLTIAFIEAMRKRQKVPTRTPVMGSSKMKGHLPKQKTSETP